MVLAVGVDVDVAALDVAPGAIEALYHRQERKAKRLGGDVGPASADWTRVSAEGLVRIAKNILGEYKQLLEAMLDGASMGCG